MTIGNKFLGHRFDQSKCIMRDVVTNDLAHCFLPTDQFVPVILSIDMTITPHFEIQNCLCSLKWIVRR